MINLTRQSDLIDTKRLEELKVLVIGAGGVGSFLVYALAKMGVKHIQVWDKDVVEPHNIPNQLYSLLDDGEVKVEALRLKVFEELGIKIKAKNAFFNGEELKDIMPEFQPDVIISGVDTMTARSKIWEGLKKIDYTGKKMFYFDTRMSARAMSLFVTPLDGTRKSYKRYEDSLFPDEEGVQDRCTAKAIIHTSFACTYVICNVLHDLINNDPVVSSYHANLKIMSFGKEAKRIN